MPVVGAVGVHDAPEEDLTGSQMFERVLPLRQDLGPGGVVDSGGRSQAGQHRRLGKLGNGRQRGEDPARLHQLQTRGAVFKLLAQVQGVLSVKSVEDNYQRARLAVGLMRKGLTKA